MEMEGTNLGGGWRRDADANADADADDVGAAADSPPALVARSRARCMCTVMPPLRVPRLYSTGGTGRGADAPGLTPPSAFALDSALLGLAAVLLHAKVDLHDPNRGLAGARAGREGSAACGSWTCSTPLAAWDAEMRLEGCRGGEALDSTWSSSSGQH
ncbi:hypothetical protein DFH06DRAFT_1196976 [Mycena polygramma]|nr:hypothetical protein DFH06DRAFT_1196976 [Mycena polygramma]